MNRITAAALIVIVLCGPAACRRRILFGDARLSDSTLTLAECFALAYEHNADMRSAYAGVVVTYGEKIESRGRFLPRVNVLYGLGREKTDSSGVVSEPRDGELAVEVRQRVAEFGKTTDAEYYRQDREREAFYERENTVAEVLSTIRRTYITLLIIDQQLASHDSLLTHYQERVTRSEDRLAKGVGLRTSLLTARLNQLETRERILSLEASRRTNLAALKNVLGLAELPQSLVLLPVPVSAVPGEDSCVVAALESSTRIDDSRAEVLQAGKALGQTGWDFVLDDISFSAGFRKDGRAASFELLSDGSQASTRQWALDVVGRKYLDEPNGTFFTGRDTTLVYTATIELSLPVFRGAQRHGTVIESGARYTKARAELIDAAREAEKATRDAYYAFELAREHLKIARERVAVSQERYELAETQHELGRMSAEGLDSFREQLFSSQDAYYGQQFEVLRREEDLRAVIRQFE